MNIALFASQQVGYEIAKFFGDSHESLSCIVLDSNEAIEQQNKIVDAANVPSQNIYYSNELYNPETILQLISMRLDLILLVWWPYIIKEAIINIPSLGCLNFHPSYLPYNRGKHYNFWTLVEDVPFGVTLHFVDAGIDTGDIAFQSLINKSWEDTGKSLYEKAQKEIVRLFKKEFPNIKAGQIPRTPQNPNEGSFHYKHELHGASEVHLDRCYSARELLNLLRARTFPPHPGAWFVEGDESYEVRVEIKKITDKNEKD